VFYCRLNIKSTDADMIKDFFVRQSLVSYMTNIPVATKKPANFMFYQDDTQSVGQVLNPPDDVS